MGFGYWNLKFGFFMKQYYYHIITFGCQMNKNDSERMESVLQSMGLEYIDDEDEADVVIMNSCSVRASAEDRVYSKARKFSDMKKKGRSHVIVAVTGCMPGRDKNGRLSEKLRDVDLYFPIKDLIMLPKMLAEINPDLRSIDLEQDYLTIKPTIQKTYQAFVTLQTGCNHFCTYCVVPFARGLEQNRPLQDIMDEINVLATNGCLEVTLLGQIVNHWQSQVGDIFSDDNPYKTSDFAKLLWEINQVDGIERIHWTAPHPLYMTDEVIDALTLPKQVNFLHLPVQSGNSDILKQMNRRHDREFFINLIQKIRAKKPDIAIGTDIIVGFCGETEEQYEDTYSLYEICDFDISYTAQYSQRSGTVAMKAFEDTVTKDEKKRRWWRLQGLMEDIVYEKNQRFVGMTVSVLVDTYKHGMCGGNSREMKRVNFVAQPDLVGTIQNIHIDKADKWLLWGTVI